MSVRLSDKATGAVLGLISRDDLQFMIQQLEEESSRDVDYFINLDTVDMLAEAGASATLVDTLKGAVGETEGIDIAWEFT